MVRGVFQLDDIASSRLGVAMEMLSQGKPFTFGDVLFQGHSDKTLACEAISAWHGTKISEVTARSELARARTAFEHLQQHSSTFAEIASRMRIRFAVIQDDEIATHEICRESEEGQLIWSEHASSG